jgi:pimeloyl-ACP methyl ester carboxylesterase
MPPVTRYAKSGDVHLAYQVVGDAPLDLVFVHGWVSNVEYGWEIPPLARFLDRLASFSRLIIFDRRGTGLSDRVSDSALPTLEQRIEDIRTVLDAVGSERAAIFGVSEGGNMSLLFAATYPERTVALVTFGIFAKRTWSPDYPWAPTPEQRQKDFESSSASGREGWTFRITRRARTLRSTHRSRRSFAGAPVRRRPSRCSA